MMPLFAEEIPAGYLVIAGLASGTGVIALVVKFIIASPERETTAYKQGGSDEHSRSEDEIKELKSRCFDQEKEIISLRNGMLRLAVATDLTSAQKREIANILGFTSTAKMLETEVKPE